MIDLIELHQAGAEVAGIHGDAWLRQSAVRNDRREVLLGRIVELQQILCRRVLPTDLTGDKPPACVTGETVPGTSGAERQTPHAQAIAGSRALDAHETAWLAAMRKRLGSAVKVARHLGINHSTVGHALAGDILRGDIIARLRQQYDQELDQAAVPVAPTTETIPEHPALTEATMPESKPHPILARIHATADQRGLTRRQMVQKLGISTSTLHNIGKGLVGTRVLAKCEAWIAAPPPITFMPRNGRVIRVDPDTMPPGETIDRHGHLGAALMAVVYHLEDGKLVERQAVLL